MSQQFSPVDALELLNLAGSTYLRVQQAYEAAKLLAQKSGVSEEDMLAADQRYMKVYADPQKT